VVLGATINRAAGRFEMGTIIVVSYVGEIVQTASKAVQLLTQNSCSGVSNSVEGSRACRWVCI